MNSHINRGDSHKLDITNRLASFAAVFVCAISICAHAAEGDDGYNETTIRLTDVPANAPAFTSYLSKPYTGENAQIQLGNDAEAKLFRTRLRQWSTHKVNFAGHYILATWGCGTDCSQIMIIDAVSGHVFHPKSISTNIAANVDLGLINGGTVWPNEGSVKFRADSKLLVLIGAPDEDGSRRGISYYAWDHNQLQLVRYVPKPY